MKIRVFLCVFIISLIFLQTAFFVFSLVSYDKRLSKYKVDEQKFVSAVDFACSNYLSKVLSPMLSNLVSSSSANAVSSSRSKPTVVLVPDIGFSTSFNGVKRCIIDGATFQTGDYCQYGLIVVVADDRLYCDDGDKFVVVRRGSSGDGRRGAPARSQRERGDAPDEQDDSAL